MQEITVAFENSNNNYVVSFDNRHFYNNANCMIG